MNTEPEIEAMSEGINFMTNQTRTCQGCGVLEYYEKYKYLNCWDCRSRRRRKKDLNLLRKNTISDNLHRPYTEPPTILELIGNLGENDFLALRVLYNLPKETIKKISSYIRQNYDPKFRKYNPYEVADHIQNIRPPLLSRENLTPLKFGMLGIFYIERLLTIGKYTRYPLCRVFTDDNFNTQYKKHIKYTPIKPLQKYFNNDVINIITDLLDYDTKQQARKLFNIVLNASFFINKCRFSLNYKSTYQKYEYNLYFMNMKQVNFNMADTKEYRDEITNLILRDENILNDYYKTLNDFLRS